MTDQPALRRRLGTVDAVVLGLGSMLGAGVFAAFAPAAQAAGSWLLLGLAAAAVVAYCNATASAQLAAQYPASGGTYLYGRERLGAWWGFLAGWGFVVGKTASLAAMAMTFAAYAVPAPWQRPTAVAAVVVLALVSHRGITRTATATRVLLTVVLAALAVGVTTGLAWGSPDSGGLVAGSTPDTYAVLQAAALLFFAFAGYARIATLAEEVRDPARTIPRAVLLALFAALAVYAVVGVTCLLVLGPTGVGAVDAPLAAVAERTGVPAVGVVVRVGAAAAALGAMLALLAGVSRTVLAMARHDDLPAWLAAVHPSRRVPHHAEVAVVAAVCLLVLVADLRGAIGFSAFGVLVYYLVANLAAWTQSTPYRRFPRALQVVGAAGCTVLALAVPLPALAGGAATFLVGVGYRIVRSRAGGS